MQDDGTINTLCQSLADAEAAGKHIASMILAARFEYAMMEYCNVFDPKFPGKNTFAGVVVEFNHHLPVGYGLFLDKDRNVIGMIRPETCARNIEIKCKAEGR
jgi:hypothetical protein